MHNEGPGPALSQWGGRSLECAQWASVRNDDGQNALTQVLSFKHPNPPPTSGFPINAKHGFMAASGQGEKKSTDARTEQRSWV